MTYPANPARAAAPTFPAWLKASFRPMRAAKCFGPTIPSVTAATAGGNMAAAIPASDLSTSTSQVNRKCAACEEQEERILRPKFSETSGDSTGEVPDIVDAALRSPGRPLDAETRAFFEPRFGQDFSHVRVHTNAAAAESARSVHALAYTVGKDIVFAAGQYAPPTTAGARLDRKSTR